MFNRLLNRFGSKFYALPKEYGASYEVTVKNTSKSHQAASLILPTVTSTEYQTLIEEVRIIPEEKIQTEPDYKNKYLVYKIALEPGQEETFKQIFKIKISPRTGMTKSFKLSDYDALDDKIK